MNKFWEIVKIQKGLIFPYKKDLKYKQATALMKQLNSKTDAYVYMMRKKWSVFTS